MTQRSSDAASTLPRTQSGDWPGEPGLGCWYTERELAALVEVFCSLPSWKNGYDRRYQEAFEEEFAAYVGASHAISVSSGGVALNLAVACLDAQPGDEVLSCALNFPGTHLAVIGRGLRLVLCEPDPRTLNLDPAEIPRRMTCRTRAVLVTHMNGLPADMSAISAATQEQADRLGVAPPRILVDAARACGAAIPTGPVGRQGWVTAFSFHRKKLMTTLGEGGMLVTSCEATAHRLRQLRSFGEREVWGSNYRMTEFQAAVGRVQLSRLDQMNDRRIAHARARSRLLAAVEALEVPPEPPGYRHVFYLYNLLLHPASPSGTRDRLRQCLLDDHAIGAVVANPPTYQSHQLIRAHTADQGGLPIAEALAARLLCPALHPQMTEGENAHIAEAIIESLALIGGSGG